MAVKAGIWNGLERAFPDEKTVDRTLPSIAIGTVTISKDARCFRQAAPDGCNALADYLQRALVGLSS
jgi:hypothetical protein